MKVIELIKNLEERYRGNSSEISLLDKYSKEDNLIAYIQNCLGTIFVIKTAKGFMGFIVTEKNFRGYYLFRIGLRETQKLLMNTNNNNDKLFIVDEENWKKFQARVALMELDYKGEDYKDYGERY